MSAWTVPVATIVAVVAVVGCNADRTTLAPNAGSSPTGGWVVAHVADGDSFDVTGPGGRDAVRIGGINAPERGECGADGARQALQQLLGDGQLTLIRDQTDRDRFGRMVRYVGRTDGLDVGAEMVREGWATSRRIRPDVARNGRYDTLEREALQAGRGQWSASGCRAPVPGVAVSVTVNADPPGSDGEHLDEEWVRFRNDGTTPLDVTGWTVADESSSNRYSFAALVLAPGASVTLFTGCGTDSDTDRHWCTDGVPIWNNEGDTVFLRNRSGIDVVAESY